MAKNLEDFATDNIPYLAQHVKKVAAMPAGFLGSNVEDMRKTALSFSPSFG